MPQGLEDVVGEAEDQQVLHRFLAQVMVDAVDLGLLEVAVQQFVQLDGRLQVPAEGLFQHQAGPAPAAVQLRLAQAGNRRSHGLRRRGQIKEAIAREIMDLFQGLDPGCQGLEILGSFGPQGLEKQAGIAPGVGLSRPGQPGLGQGLPGQGAKALIPQVPLAGDPQEDEASFPAVLLAEMVEGGQELAAHQVAGGAEDHEQVRFHLVIGHSSVVIFFQLIQSRGSSRTAPTTAC